MKATPLLTALVVSGLLFAPALPANAATPHTAAPAATPLPASESGKVDLNTADIPTLEAIPEIGTNYANAVVASRPFKSVDDLDRILKIGPEKMSRLKEKVTASKVKTAAPAPAGVRPSGPSKPSTVNEGKATDSAAVTERYDAKDRDRAKGEKKAEPQK